MTRRIRIGDGAVLETILSTNQGWIVSLNDRDQDRLSKEITDLIYNGQMMADQGAAFSSKRTLTIGDDTIVLYAQFGHPSFWQRLFGLFGG